MSMQVFVLHPYTKFEVRRPSHSEDMADFPSWYGMVALNGLVYLTFDLLIWELELNM